MYILLAKCQQQGHAVFCHNRPKALAQFDPSNVLHINGKG